MPSLNRLSKQPEQIVRGELTISQSFKVPHFICDKHNAHLLSVQFSCSVSCLTLSNPMDCSASGFPVHHQLPELIQTHVHRVGDDIQPSHPLFSPSPPAFSLSQHQGISSESVLHIRYPEYWSFGFSISPFNEYSGLISFRIDSFDLLAVKGILKSLLQHHISKA